MLEFYKTQKSKGAVSQPYVAINCYAYLNITKALVKNYHLGNKKYALLGYDAEKQTIAIKLLNDISPGAYKLSDNTCGNLQIVASGFFVHFDLPITNQRFYDVDFKEDTLFLKLAK